MRTELAEIENCRRCFRGTFDKLGTRRGFKHPLTTILLKDIVDVARGKVVTDHVWLTMGKRLAKLDLKEGDTVKFDARVTEYQKGYKGHRDDEDFEGNYKPLEYDYRLSFPTNIIKLQFATPNQTQISSFF